VFLVARGSEVQLSDPCTGAERCRSAVPLLLTGVLLWIVLASPAQAQESQPGEPTTGKQTTSSLATSTSNDHPRSPEASDRQKPPVEKKHHDRGSFVIAPLPISSPALGSGVIPVLAYIFPLSSHDKTSPASVIGGRASSQIMAAERLLWQEIFSLERIPSMPRPCTLAAI
jgi:hypothetical protein